jgi:transposase
MKPYSKDLRIRVLAAVDRGVPREEVARTFSVSAPTIKRWLKRRRETGDVEAKPIPGRPSVKGAALKGWLPSHLRENDDDLTLEEHREAFEEARGGMTVSASTVGRAIARLPQGWPLKKKPRVASERDERERAAFGERIGSVDPRRLVAVDECGTHTSMTRFRARAPRGERAYGKVPRNRGKNTTLIASMTLEGGMGEAMAVEGATDARVFEAYVEGFLAPSLSAG